MLPVEILREAVESYAPVFWEPTQYGSPYHALRNAVLARADASESKSAYADRAVRSSRTPQEELGHA